MSLVGTRPILQDELEQYELHHRARIATKPGITGMWQVSGRSNITDFEEVVRLDTEYITTIFTLCSVMSVFVVAVRYKEKNAVIQKISQNTLGIYLIHVIVLRFMERILPVSLMTHLGVSVLYIAVIMMLSLGITEIIHRIPIVHRIL